MYVCPEPAELVDDESISGNVITLESHESTNSAPLPDEILLEIQKAQTPIVQMLNRWLSQLEGQTFPPEQAKEIVDTVRHLVSCAACELILESQPVRLYVSTPKRALNAIIMVKNLHARPAKNLYNKTAFPALRARPISSKNT